MSPEKEITKEIQSSASNVIDLDALEREVCILKEKLKKAELKSEILMGAYFLTDERFKNDTRTKSRKANL